MKTLTRKAKLIELIRTLDEAKTSWDHRSNGDGPTLMPRQYHEGSYAELEHQLAQMRDHPTWRKPWWHLNHRYRWGTTHRETVPYRRTRQGPSPRLRPNTELINTGTAHGHHISVIVYEWTPEVRTDQVDWALEHLLTTMHHGRPDAIRLPLDVFYRAIGIAPPAERNNHRTPATVEAA